MNKVQKLMECQYKNDNDSKEYACTIKHGTQLLIASDVLQCKQRVIHPILMSP